MVDDPARASVDVAVTAFYNSLPFNYLGTVSDFAASIRQRNAVELEYPNVHSVLRSRPDLEVADVGCGTGWFATTVALHYGLRVVGYDLSALAIERAEATMLELGVSRQLSFTRVNLFDLPPRVFPFVNCLGVLHHTHDCRAALACVLRLLPPGGYLHLGLYHRYGRAPFLKLFAPYREKVLEQGRLEREEEDEAFAMFRALLQITSDQTLARSWFRDQVLHPHETQHTLEEVNQWLGQAGCQVLSTSLNGFRPIQSLERIVAEESFQEKISYRRNVLERKYYPGFFTLLAQKG